MDIAYFSSDFVIKIVRGQAEIRLLRGLGGFAGLLLHDEGAWSAVELKPRVSRVGGRGAAVLTCLGVH